jgi:hypothetical protein
MSLPVIRWNLNTSFMEALRLALIIDVTVD